MLAVFPKHCNLMYNTTIRWTVLCQKNRRWVLNQDIWKLRGQNETIIYGIMIVLTGQGLQRAVNKWTDEHNRTKRPESHHLERGSPFEDTVNGSLIINKPTIQTMSTENDNNSFPDTLQLEKIILNIIPIFFRVQKDRRWLGSNAPRIQVKG